MHIDLCNLPAIEGLEGESLAKELGDPKTAKDRNVMLPGMYPNEYAIINQDWRYIHYRDDTEELYNVQKDVNEWYNLAEEDKYDSVKESMRASAPEEFAEPLNSKQWKLVLDGTSYSWEDK